MSLFVWVSSDKHNNGFLLSALTRELGVFLLLAGLVGSYLTRKKKESAIWALTLIILVLAYFLHLNLAKPFTSAKPNQSFFAWQVFRLDAFIAISEFGFVAVLYNKIWAFPLLIISTIGTYLLLNGENRFFLLGTILITTMVFLALGRDPGAGYWEVVWMLLVISTVPSFFVFLEKKLKEIGG